MSSAKPRTPAACLAQGAVSAVVAVPAEVSVPVDVPVPEPAAGLGGQDGRLRLHTTSFLAEAHYVRGEYVRGVELAPAALG